MIVTITRETDAIPVSGRPRPQRRSLLLAAAAVALACWAIWSLPVIGWSEWFPLDFGYLITLDQEWKRNAWKFLSPYAEGSGRYFPFYWLIFGIQSALFGTSVWPYAYTLCAVMLGSLWAVCWIVFKTTHRRDASLLLLPLPPPIHTSCRVSSSHSFRPPLKEP
jgi:hypothetical protein